MENIDAEGCLNEVSFLVWMEVQDFRADMQLAEACRADATRLCGKVEPGEGRVHQCLREHANQLSPLCRSAVAVDRSTTCINDCCFSLLYVCTIAPGPNFPFMLQAAMAVFGYHVDNQCHSSERCSRSQVGGGAVAHRACIVPGTFLWPAALLVIEAARWLLWCLAPPLLADTKGLCYPTSLAATGNTRCAWKRRRRRILISTWV